MVTIVNGLVGGLVATVVMTAVMMLLGGDDPPPTAVLWSKYVGDNPPEEYLMQGMVLHLVYGTIAGGVFAALALGLDFVSLATIGSAVLWGVVWAIVLLIIAVVFWMIVILGMEPGGMSMMATQLGLHLVYGVVLAGWLFYDVVGLG